VNAIAPGFVKTEFFAKGSEERINRMFDNEAARAPLRRNQTVEDIANAVAFLASDVSSNITGQCLHVDSGAVML
jgi:enoyl-[acyl-carrier-protein] reductase (NADH)